MKPGIKVCGITSAAFAAEAARRGVDYLGVIFAEGSPRRVSTETAAEIAASARNAVAQTGCPKIVGVFTNRSAEDIAEIARRVPLDIVQLHNSDYGANEISRLHSEGLEVWRLASGEGGFAGEDAVLLDGSAGGRSGGTGTLADWSRVGELKRAGRRVVLAGGISTANVVAAAATGADVIDVNSSLETSPGCKDSALLSTFLLCFRGNF